MMMVGNIRFIVLSLRINGNLYNLFPLFERLKGIVNSGKRYCGVLFLYLLVYVFCTGMASIALEVIYPGRRIFLLLPS
jgi:hypothetical protein